MKTHAFFPYEELNTACSADTPLTMNQGILELYCRSSQIQGKRGGFTLVAFAHDTISNKGSIFSLSGGSSTTTSFVHVSVSEFVYVGLQFAYCVSSPISETPCSWKRWVYWQSYVVILKTNLRAYVIGGVLPRSEGETVMIQCRICRGPLPVIRTQDRLEQLKSGRHMPEVRSANTRPLQRQSISHCSCEALCCNNAVTGVAEKIHFFLLSAASFFTVTWRYRYPSNTVSVTYTWKKKRRGSKTTRLPRRFLHLLRVHIHWHTNVTQGVYYTV